MADKSGQTEQPTQRRLDKARKDGRFLSAKEFVSALQFMVFLFLLSVEQVSVFGMTAGRPSGSYPPPASTARCSSG